ncbi:MAG: DUF2269 family protein [Bacillota bacterium]
MLLLVRTLHILAAIWFVGGVTGYIFTRLAMLRTENVAAVDALVCMMARFRNLMLRIGGILLVIFGLWTAYYESWPEFSRGAIVLLVILVPFMVLTARGSHKLEVVCAETVQAGSVTPVLRAAMRDRLLVAGEIGLGVITVLFLLLMLVKPS